jgi:hypothetical protein
MDCPKDKWRTAALRLNEEDGIEFAIELVFAEDRSQKRIQARSECASVGFLKGSKETLLVKGPLHRKRRK